MELKNPVKRLKLEFRFLIRHYPDYDFMQRFQEFCRQKDLTENEINNLIQNHLTKVQPETINPIIDNWQDGLEFLIH